ncbi:MAG TPA: hypothetical protein VN622_02740 [Clostridia bacterium]|nr:hypothetical protein [Clostridia bacterium]
MGGRRSHSRTEKLGTTYLTIAVVSFSALTFELVQTRILSFIFWNHIVYLAISIALLGFGISGSFVTWLKRRSLNTAEDTAGAIARCTAAMSISMLLSVVVISRALPLMTDVDSAWKLMICYIVSVPPFIFAGATISLIMAYAAATTGRLYFFDLVAASFGCVLFFVLLPALGAVGAVSLLALLVAACAILWTRSSALMRTPTSGFSIAVVAVLGSMLLFGLRDKFEYLPEPYKELAEMLSKGAHLERTRWTTLARIDVVGGHTPQVLNYTEHPPDSYKIITQDGSAHTRLVGSGAIADIFSRVASGAQVHPSGITYSVLNHPDVAIIGTGGGIDVAYALANNPSSVFTVELNPYTHRLTTEDYQDWNSHMMSDPRVTAIHAEGRNAIRSIDRKFDLVQIIAIDTFAALNAGAYVLSENYLYTVEAFQDYFSHLKPNGYLAMYRWNSFPPKETLRLTSLAAEAWRRSGVNRVGNRVMVIGDDVWALSIFKNGEFSEAEVNALAEAARRADRSVLYWPKVRPAAEQREFEQFYYEAHNDKHIPEFSAAFNELLASYDSGTQSEFFRKYPYKIVPTSDDSPFFFETSSLSDLDNWSLNTLRGSSVQSTMFQITIAATIAMICAIFLPLYFFDRGGIAGNGSGSFTLYFASLGFGFMLLEVALMQKAILLLGNPMYSIPAVLSGMLLSAGIGSGVSSRWGVSFRRKITIATAVLVLSVAAFAVGFAGLSPILLRMSMTIRVAATVLGIVPIGFALGIFFPAGLEVVRDRARLFVPWAWGINGCASVYGSVAATIAAMWHGFNVVLLFGVTTYLVALVAGYRAESLLVQEARSTARIAEPVSSSPATD